MDHQSEPHLNSLGYVIGGKQGRAMIAWGYDHQARRISIGEAHRGARDGLTCECGSPLVAKKGDIKAHHFAHKAGNVRFCEVASMAAMLNFIADTLLDGGSVDLPVTAGVFSRAQVLALSKEVVGNHHVFIIDAQRSRRLLVHVRQRRQDLGDLARWCAEQPVSGMTIDLIAFRNRSDDELRRALRSTALRSWLFRNEAHDKGAPASFLRRLYGLR